MKTAFVVVVLAALLAGAATGGDVYIPDNNPTTGNAGTNHWPFDIYTAWRYHLLLPAPMLGGKPFRLKEVSVAFSGNASNWSASQFQLRMAHTTQTTLSMTFATNLGASPVALIDGPITFNAVASTWTPLGITGAFDYDGSSSLVLELRYIRSSTAGTTVWADNRMCRCYTHSGSSADPYNAATAIAPTPGALMGMKVRLTTVDTQITGSGSGRIGTAVTLSLLSPADGGLPYQVGTSLGNGPTPIGNRQIGLSLDDLLVVSVGGLLPGVFQNYAGILDASGQATAKIVIPNNPGLVGVRLYSAFVTLKSGAPFHIESISDTFAFSVIA